MPNPTLIAGTKNNAAISSGTSATVTSTGSVTNGNLQIVMIAVGGASAPSAITAPAGGWTTFLTTTATLASGLIVAAIFYKQATVTGSFSGAFTWTGTATSGEWLFTEWSGAGASLVDGTVGTTLNASGTSPTSPSITPGAGNVNDTLVSVLFAGATGAAQANTPTIPSGMSSVLTVASASGTEFFGCASLALASASATGAKTWTLAHANSSMGASFLIQQGPTWDFTPVLPLSQRRRPTAQLRQRAEFAYFPFQPFNWEANYPQPPHPKVLHKEPVFDRGDDGIEQIKLPFQPYGWEVAPPFFRSINTAQYRNATRGKSEFGVFPIPTTALWGWEIQSVQPGHPRPERTGAVMRGDDGTEQILLNWFNAGWEVQPPQPPHQTPEKRAAAVMRGDDGIEQIKLPWQNAGWEIAPVQPGHPRPERSGSIARGDDGTEQILLNWFNAGWELQPPQPPHPKPERSGALARGDDGTENTLAVAAVAFFETPLVFPRKAYKIVGWPGFGDDGISIPFANWINAGWEIQSVQPPQPKVLHKSGVFARGDEGNEQIQLPWFNAGWEIQSIQPPHPRPERSGAIARGDDGTENTFVLVTPPFGYDSPAVYYRRPIRTIGFPVNEDGIEFPLTSFLPYGWEIPSPQPPHPKPERSGSIARGDDGTEAVFVFVPTTLSFFESQLPTLAIRRPFLGGLVQEVLFAFPPPFQPYGWEVSPFQPSHPKPERSGAIARGDDGTEQILLNWFNAGWEVQPPPPPHPRPERSGAIARGDDGTELPFVFVAITTPPFIDAPGIVLARPRLTFSALAQKIVFTGLPPWFNAGWEIQSVQPPHPWISQRGSGAFSRGDDGIGSPLLGWFNAGWEVQPPQPPHPMWQRQHALYGQVRYLSPPFVPYGWEVAPPMIRHPVPERSQGVRGTSTFANFGPFLPYGWEIAPFQPPVPISTPQRRSATRGKSEFTTAPIVPFIGRLGFQTELPNIRHPTWNRHQALYGRVQYQSPPFLPYGWEIPSPMIRHPSPERSQGVRGHVAFANFGPFLPYGWEIAPPYLGRKGWIKQLDIGDDGISSTFVFVPFLTLPNSDWTSLPLIPHPHWSRGWAGIYSGEPGIEAPFVPTAAQSNMYIWHHRTRRGRA